MKSKNQLYFYVIMQKPKMKLCKQFHLNIIKKDKLLRDTVNKRSARHTLRTLKRIKDVNKWRVILYL